MANNIRTFVNEADNQTYNCATFYSEIDGRLIGASNPFIQGINDASIYPEYYRVFHVGKLGNNDDDVRPKYRCHVADELICVEDAYSFTLDPSFFPDIQETGSSLCSGAWQNTGVMINGKYIWLGMYGKLQSVNSWMSCEWWITQYWSATEPQTLPQNTSSNLLLGNFNGGSVGYPMNDTGKSQCYVYWTKMKEFFSNATVYFTAGNFYANGFSNKHDIVGWVFIKDNEFVGTGTNPWDSNTSFIVNNYTTLSAEDADDYRPGREPVPHTDDLERAVVSAKTAKAAFKQYDAALAKVARTGNYNDLTNKPSSYSLPTMSSSTKGGAKLGTGLTVSNDVLSIDETWLDAKIDAALGVILNANY